MNQYERLLGVNIDHVATVRQARGTRYPEPVQAALVAEQAGENYAEHSQKAAGIVAEAVRRVLDAVPDVLAGLVD